jgi:hypothetical protein
MHHYSPHILAAQLSAETLCRSLQNVSRQLRSAFVLPPDFVMTQVSARKYTQGERLASRFNPRRGITPARNPNTFVMRVSVEEMVKPKLAPRSVFGDHF